MNIIRISLILTFLLLTQLYSIAWAAEATCDMKASGQSSVIVLPQSVEFVKICLAETGHPLKCNNEPVKENGVVLYSLPRWFSGILVASAVSAEGVRISCSSIVGQNFWRNIDPTIVALITQMLSFFGGLVAAILPAHLISIRNETKMIGAWLELLSRNIDKLYLDRLTELYVDAPPPVTGRRWILVKSISDKINAVIMSSPSIQYMSAQEKKNLANILKELLSDYYDCKPYNSR